MAETYLPAGTAVGNADAVRQGSLAQWFWAAGNILAGTDDQHVMEPGTQYDGLLGPTPTLGADIGVGANGDIFFRGRTTAANGTTQTAAAGTVSPVTLLLIAAVAYFVLK